MLKNCFNSLNAVSRNVRAFAGLLAFAFIANAAEPDYPELLVREVQKNSNGTQYQIGDRISLQVQLGNTVVEPNQPLNLTVMPGTPKLEDQGWYLDPNTQTITGTLRFIVSPIQTGKVTLPPLLISAEGNKSVARTSPFSIEVMGPKAEPNHKAELLPVVSIKLPTRFWFILSGILLALILIFYRIYKFFRGKKGKTPLTQSPVIPAEPDHSIALGRLDALFRNHPYSIENLKPICFGCSEIIKEFFSKRFGIEATESTTDEMIELLRREALSKENLKEIQSLFQELDMIKFTRAENYSHYKEDQYLGFKIKSQIIIQKWRLDQRDPVRGSL